MRTIHKYIGKYPIANDSTKLILGTIHPHYTENFLVDFFYGNEASIWKILNRAFPDELLNPTDLKSILTFLREKKLSISDTIIECERNSPTALDKDLNPIKLNYQLKESIFQSNISEILFTSGFGKNNAFYLFYCKILGLKLNKEIKNNREVILPSSLFERPIKLKILYSPSGTANTGIASSKNYLANKHLYVGRRTPIADFKIDHYKLNFT